MKHKFNVWLSSLHADSIAKTQSVCVYLQVIQRNSTHGAIHVWCESTRRLLCAASMLVKCFPSRNVNCKCLNKTKKNTETKPIYCQCEMRAFRLLWDIRAVWIHFEKSAMAWCVLLANINLIYKIEQLAEVMSLYIIFLHRFMLNRFHSTFG